MTSRAAPRFDEGALRRQAGDKVFPRGQAYHRQGRVRLLDLIEPGTDRYLRRPCHFATCPKGRRECAVPGCGATSFLRQHDEFAPGDDLLAPARSAMLYRRGEGRLRSALDVSALLEAGEA